MTKEPLVTILCPTYNHEKYIQQCIAGFVMQKTCFQYEIVVHDDASTDNTVKILKDYEKKYPNLFKNYYQTRNQYSQNVSLLKIMAPLCHGKYIALCEGDDYWTDPYKLQKQIDFLEANPEYSLTCHRYKIYDTYTKNWLPDYGHDLFNKNTKGIEITMTNFFGNWLLKTLTVVFRKSMFDISLFGKYKYLRDIHLFFHLVKIGPGYCFNFDGGVYRLHEGGIHSNITPLDRDITSLKVYTDLYHYNKDSKELKNVVASFRYKVWHQMLNDSKMPIFDFQLYKIVLNDYISTNSMLDFLVKIKQITWKSGFKVKLIFKQLHI